MTKKAISLLEKAVKAAEPLDRDEIELLLSWLSNKHELLKRDKSPVIDDLTAFRERYNFTTLNKNR
jgi:hypothetical protein